MRSGEGSWQKRDRCLLCAGNKEEGWEDRNEERRQFFSRGYDGGNAVVGVFVADEWIEEVGVCGQGK